MDNEKFSQILVLENEGLIRSGMKALIQIADPTARIHEASSYEQAMSIFSSLPIDIAFLDYDLQSDKNGLDVLLEIREKELDTRAVMLSSHRNRELVLKCIDAGASGYIPKGMDDDNGSTFRRALDTVIYGGVFLPAFVFGRGGESPESNRSSTMTNSADSLEFIGIKGRQLEVLYYLCQGLPNKTIAKKMNISEHTVRKNHVSQIFIAFNVTRRTALIVEVSRRGIIIPKPKSAL